MTDLQSGPLFVEDNLFVNTRLPVVCIHKHFQYFLEKGTKELKGQFKIGINPLL